MRLVQEGRKQLESEDQGMLPDGAQLDLVRPSVNYIELAGSVRTNVQSIKAAYLSKGDISCITARINNVMRPLYLNDH